jgi:hypothetical protein
LPNQMIEIPTGKGVRPTESDGRWVLFDDEKWMVVRAFFFGGHGRPLIRPSKQDVSRARTIHQDGSSSKSREVQEAPALARLLAWAGKRTWKSCLPARGAEHPRLESGSRSRKPKWYGGIYPNAARIFGVSSITA